MHAHRCRWEKVDVLPQGATTKYLGRELRLDFHDEAEIENQINMAWRRFMGLRQELCNRRFSLRLRMKVFGAAVSQTLLYGAGTWTLNKERERKLRTAQRSMLRSMMIKQRREANKESSTTKADMRPDEGLEGEEEELEESEEEEEEEKEKTEEEEEEKE